MYGVFCAAMHDLGCHLVDALPELGGQLAALYPDKPIYDLPGFPDILAGQFCEHLKQQMQPARPNLVLGDRVVRVEGEPGAMRCHTESGRVLESAAVLLAGGKGAFKPRRPGIDGIAPYEGKSLFLNVPKGVDWTGKRIAVQGGGDSALDWAVRLVELGARGDAGASTGIVPCACAHRGPVPGPVRSRARAHAGAGNGARGFRR